MNIYDAEEAQRSAKLLREIADRLDRREIKHVSLLAINTVESAHKYGYVFVSLHASIESIGTGEYLLTLGTLRDHFIDGEEKLRAEGRQVSKMMTDEDAKQEFER